ncbi:MAG: FAD-dependent oxidoreductase [Candidatus Brocadiia bacterium]|jgi:pyruvate/2-oxoglutarate dehydrogenase complex dihydrolipoamide dehydrogenase (E3) component|nr:FAD-dependent oxidoreductase [Candidatus Brocadiia bacterium]
MTKRNETSNSDATVGVVRGPKEYDLVIIGAGAGGLSAASGAAGLGASVALVEKREALGGDCLFHGCVPSKAFIEAGRLAWRAKNADAFGIRIPDVQVDFGAVMAHVHDRVAAIGEHDSAERFRAMGVDVYFGGGHFESPHEFAVGDVVLKGRRFAIATGSGPVRLPIPGLDEVDYLTNLNVFDLKEQPGSLVVLGGGPIGVELGQAFARLGTDVTIIESTEFLLRKDDHELCPILHEAIRREGITLLLRHRAERITKHADGRIQVTCSGPDGEATAAGDALLVSLGRAANLDGLGLEAAGVEYTPRGIGVDRRLRTTQKHIYALGDCSGGYQFTHVAEYEAGIVVPNALFGIPRKADFSVVPWCTFTDPEMAHVGLTEEEAREQGVRKLEVYRYEFKEADRAIIDRRTEGMIKLICSGKKLLGAHLIGESAAEMLHEYVLMMANGRPVTGISRAIHVYPTISQAARRAANRYYDEHLFKSPVVNWLKRLRRLHGASIYERQKEADDA